MKSSKILFWGVLLILFWSCSDLGDSEVTGCMETSACNHNPDATISDGSCLQLDCNNECGGDAVTDSCGTCAGTIMNSSECECPDGQTKDCAGECGGTAEEDCTGECGGTNQNCVSFSSEIQPIFNNNCGNCHLDNSYGGLNLSNYDNVMAGGGSGAVIEPGDHDNSYLWERVDNGEMPPGSNPDLSPEQVNLIKQWINEGAQDN